MDSLLSSGGHSSDIRSVSLSSNGMVHLSGLLACNKYIFRSQLMKPLVSKLSDAKNYLTEMGKILYFWWWFSSGKSFHKPAGSVLNCKTQILGSNSIVYCVSEIFDMIILFPFDNHSLSY
jgi:hypothetical protein